MIHHVLPNRHSRLQKTKKMMKMDQPLCNKGSAPVAQVDLEKLGSELGGNDEGHTTDDIGEWGWIR